MFPPDGQKLQHAIYANADGIIVISVDAEYRHGNVDVGIFEVGSVESAAELASCGTELLN